MAEQRLIDAKALWKNVDKLPSVLDANNGWLVKKTSVLAKIEDATVVEPKPVVHAYWRYSHDNGTFFYYRCSHCDCEIIIKAGLYAELNHHSYCPNCGAQMDEKEG